VVVWWLAELGWEAQAGCGRAEAGLEIQLSLLGPRPFRRCSSRLDMVSVAPVTTIFLFATLHSPTGPIASVH
jgi:hypothetical protein